MREAVEGLPCIYPALEPKPTPKHLPEAERAVWRDAIFDCGEACMLHHKHLWAKTTADMVVKAMVDRRQNFSEEQQRTLQEWNATVKGQFIMRQQAPTIPYYGYTYYSARSGRPSLVPPCGVLSVGQTLKLRKKRKGKRERSR